MYCIASNGDSSLSASGSKDFIQATKSLIEAYLTPVLNLVVMRISTLPHIYSGSTKSLADITALYTSMTASNGII